MQYPTREAFFAHKFCRILTKTAAAMEIGAQACWMLTVIAMQEDSKRYTGHVTYWNEQLMALAGCGSKNSFIRLRSKAIEFGWLHYEQGGKGRPGRYWVLIPSRYDAIPDGPCDEDVDAIGAKNGTVNGTTNGTNQIYGAKIDTTTGRQTEPQRDGKREPFIPSPKPNPIPKESTKEKEPHELDCLGPRKPPDPEKFVDDVSEEALLIEIWNATPGTVHHSMDKLSAKLSPLFVERIRGKPDWQTHWKIILSRFPLPWFNGTNVGIGTFLEKFDDIADPNGWPHKPKNRTAKPGTIDPGGGAEYVPGSIPLDEDGNPMPRKWGA